MSQVLMVTRIGDQEINIGKCTHAQARILQKKEHGRIEDGKLFLHIRPIHLQIATNQRVRGPNDDDNVSQAEIERRLDWLSHLMGNVATAQAKAGQSNLEEIRGASDAMVRAVQLPLHRSLLERHERSKNLPGFDLLSIDLDGQEPDNCPTDPLPEDLWGSHEMLAAERYKNVWGTEVGTPSESITDPKTLETVDALLAKNLQQLRDAGALEIRTATTFGTVQTEKSWGWREVDGRWCRVPRYVLSTD